MFRFANITLGQYAVRDSIVHRLDPRTKITISFSLMIMLLSVNRLWLLGLFLFFTLLFFQLAQLSWDIAWKNVKSFYILLLLTFFLHVAMTDGEIWLQIPYVGVTITREGCTQGLFYSFRIVLLIVIANLLTLTTAPMELTDAVERFLRPFSKWRIPSHEIALMLSISLRFIPIFLDEAQRIQNAQISRGARFDGSLIQKIRNLIPIIIPLFLSTFRKANELAMAMDSRCYQGGEGRTVYHELRFRWQDHLALALVALFIIPVFLL